MEQFLPGPIFVNFQRVAVAVYMQMENRVFLLTADYFQKTQYKGLFPVLAEGAGNVQYDSG